VASHFSPAFRDTTTPVIKLCLNVYFWDDGSNWLARVGNISHARITEAHASGDFSAALPSLYSMISLSGFLHQYCYQICRGCQQNLTYLLVLTFCPS